MPKENLEFMSLFDFPLSIHPPFFFSLSLFFLYQSYLPDFLHPNHLPACVWGGNGKVDYQTVRPLTLTHTHTHTPHKVATRDSNVNCLLTSPPLYFSHTPLEQAYGQMQIRPNGGDASDSVLWNPSDRLR